MPLQQQLQQPLQQCERCEELLALYRQANERFRELARAFAKSTGGRNREFLSLLWQESREAHAECETVLQVFLSHLNSHNVH